MVPTTGARKKRGRNLPFDQEGQWSEFTAGDQLCAAPAQLGTVRTLPATLHQVAFGHVESAGSQVGERGLEVLCARRPAGERAAGFESTKNAQGGRMSLGLCIVDDGDQLQVTAAQGHAGVTGSAAWVPASRDSKETVVPCESSRGLIQVMDRDLYVVELESRAARRGAALERAQEWLLGLRRSAAPWRPRSARGSRRLCAAASRTAARTCGGVRGRRPAPPRGRSAAHRSLNSALQTAKTTLHSSARGGGSRGGEPVELALELSVLPNELVHHLVQGFHELCPTGSRATRIRAGAGSASRWTAATSRRWAGFFVCHDFGLPSQWIERF